MKEEYTGNRIIRYRSSILLGIFMIIALLLVVFLITIAVTINGKRDTNGRFATIEDKATRGSIISSDGYALSYSQKQYRAEVHTLSIDPKKRELFFNLFSIYSGIPRREIERKFRGSDGEAIKGRVILSDNIDVRLASDLISLGHKMNRMKIFRPLNIRKPHLVLGLDIIAYSEKRYFPHKKLLTPTVGYMQVKDEDGYKSPIAIKGLEKTYSSYLLPDTDGLIKGKRDVFGTVIRTGKSKTILRADGMNLHLNVALGFQQSVEKAVDKMKRQVGADEILVAVMDSQTGKVLSLVSSERFDPDNIRQRDVKALNPNFSEYLYEPGSVIKPLTLAVALDNKKINLSQKIKLGGKHKVNENYTITDDSYFKSLTPIGIITYSSNIGIAKIAWKLSGKELYDGFRGFGLSQKSGIDLSKELKGKIQPPYKLDYPTYSANSAYGYGMYTNFMQLVKAYSAFNNSGMAVTPKIVDYLSDSRNRKYDINRDTYSLKACSPKTAERLHTILMNVVEKGTGSAAQYDGLEVGGKTGTAHIAYKGKYIEEYHSSFYGFVNDKFGNKYTIGVLFVKPKKVYFASQTAAPMFFDVVSEMVKFDYLQPDELLAKLHLSRRADMRKRKRDAYARKIKAYNKKHGIDQ
ncbi:penicillin-binding protein 2 [Sulfurovum sp. bin170]|uniref:peptidoglycan D,D-transpeptidase FtsI family protein n=1 Tax=Sulfurovum sp. bin170 TaxID=2695268 RepID=UPI0013DFE001|nr:penicillin-binding protein 2 [Sulfurovum sp. bin170]NEW61608.1 penicillin-binding protein 2 [Sulfurovum sp. bin170]